MTLLIKNGSVVSATGTRKADVLIKSEKISSVAETILPAEDMQVVDARGKLVMPGGIDVHTHLDLVAGPDRASDDWYTGTVAAACGGTTTVVDHPAFGPAGCSVFHQIHAYLGLAANAVIDYSLHGVIQRVDDAVLADLHKLVSFGVSSSKVYMTYDFRLSDEQILCVLKRMMEVGGLTAVHCEDHKTVTGLRARFGNEGKTEPWFHPLSRPARAESLAIKRMIGLAERAGDAPIYIVHLSTGEGLEIIRKAQGEGLPVFAETCPQYLVLSDERYREPDRGGLKYVMSPPLRKPADQDALWKGLQDSTIQTIATDHCPFFFSLKKQRGAEDFRSCPNGAPGVETRLPVIFSEGVAKGRITVERFVDLVSTTPAKLLGLYPQKGAIEVGADADLVIFDPKKKGTITQKSLHERVDYSPYEGLEITGYPTVTISRGSIVFQNGDFCGSKGSGRFVRRSQYAGL